MMRVYFWRVVKSNSFDIEKYTVEEVGAGVQKKSLPPDGDGLIVIKPEKFTLPKIRVEIVKRLEF